MAEVADVEIAGESACATDAGSAVWGSGWGRHSACHTSATRRYTSRSDHGGSRDDGQYWTINRISKPEAQGYYVFALPE
jgi:hypothetical protein